ncbi:MAG: phosphoadenosine phosphosulfate reductase [Clostridia bacterium]|nr:phosphoadenosine phosphosulfate reductase [Clostridia bacterium]
MTYQDFKHALLTLSTSRLERIDALRHTVNIVGVSGGKDSLATCILLHWLGIPFKTVTAEVWWKEGITGENPYHYEFLHGIAVPKLNSWGTTCDFIRSKTTAYEYMTTPIAYSKNHPDRIGKTRGFPLCGKCGIQRDCKARPCEKYYKSQTESYTVITGIAADEKDRILTNAANNRISVLELFDIPEYETYGICVSEKLLSPTYTFSDRGGCWFCPNQKIQELELLYRVFPRFWNELMEIQRLPNKVQENFNRTQTLYDIEEQIKHGVQQRLFVGAMMKGD